MPLASLLSRCTVKRGNKRKIVPLIRPYLILISKLRTYIRTHLGMMEKYVSVVIFFIFFFTVHTYTSFLHFR